jgi:hypothetical protein
MTREDLRGLVDGAAPEALPDLIGDLEAAKARALARVATSALGTGNTRPEEEQLLTLPEVARALRATEDYVYTLARQRRIPTVRLPGLARGGRIREGKYLRVRASSLRSLLASLEDRGIEGGFNTVIKSLHGRRRGPKDPQTPRAVADGVRATRGRHVRDGEPMGDGQNEHP